MNTELDGLPCAPSLVDDFLSEPPDAVVKAVGRMGGNFMVLGAGGKMGLHLCLMLRKAIDRSGRNSRLTAVSRFGNASDRTPFESRGVAVQACDLCKPGDLESLESAENIIFLAGAKFGTAGQPGLLRRMNVEMPEMVANHFSNSRITAFSTGCVYSFVPVDSAGSSEDSETNPVGEYALSCLGREQAFRRSALEFGSRLALIRLNYSVNSDTECWWTSPSGFCGRSDRCDHGPCESHLAARRSRSDAAIPRTGQHSAIHHQHHGSLGPPCARSRRTLRGDFWPRSDHLRPGGGYSLAQRRHTLPPALRRTGNHAGPDDRLGGGLADARTPNPGQTNRI